MASSRELTLFAEKMMQPTARSREQTEQVRALDAATRLRRTFGGQVAANLTELRYGG